MMNQFRLIALALIVLVAVACAAVENEQPPVVQVQHPAIIARQKAPARVAQLLPTSTPAPHTPIATASSPSDSASAAEQSGIRAKQGLASADIATWTPTPTNTPLPLPTATPTPWVDLATGHSMFNEWRWIDVDLSRQYLTAYENGQPVYQVYISSGAAQFPTVTGQFRIYLRYESQTMDGRYMGPEYDYVTENVPYVQYFYQGYALHGAYWHNDFGTPVSHGCVNLTPYDAQWLFNFADIGTLVNVHY